MIVCGRLYEKHHFSYYGEPGTSAPECQRLCGAKNPKYDPSRDRTERHQRGSDMYSM